MLFIAERCIHQQGASPRLTHNKRNHALEWKEKQKLIQKNKNKKKNTKARVSVVYVVFLFICLYVNSWRNSE